MAGRLESDSLGGEIIKKSIDFLLLERQFGENMSLVKFHSKNNDDHVRLTRDFGLQSAGRAVVTATWWPLKSFQ